MQARVIADRIGMVSARAADDVVMRLVRDDDADDDGRHSEIDAALAAPIGAAAFAAAIAGVLLTPDYGFAFLTFGALPALYWIAGYAGIRRLMPLRAWNIGLHTVAAFAIVGATYNSGGASSPTLAFAPVIGIVGLAFFPRSPVAISIGPGMIIASLVADAVAGRPPASLLPVASFAIVATCLPIIVLRLVDVELHHRHTAVVDPLTGCLNRRAFDGRVFELEQQSRVVGGHFAAMVFDLDHFKDINDTHGHQTGDRVLVDVAYRVRSRLRRFELVYRIGGEEFLVLLPGIELEQARAIAEQVRLAIADTDIDGVRVTASVGVAAQPSPVDIVELVGAADELLYQAKERGRNVVVA